MDEEPEKKSKIKIQKSKLDLRLKHRARRFHIHIIFLTFALLLLTLVCIFLRQHLLSPAAGVVGNLPGSKANLKLCSLKSLIVNLGFSKGTIMKSCFSSRSPMGGACVLLLVLVLNSISYSMQTSQVDSLRIISATPSRLTETRDQSRMIVVIFNKPMVPLQALPQFEEKGPLMFDPPLSGKYRWLGPSTLTFVPADTRPFATEYKAKVPAGTRALDGSVLASDYEWTFQTPRPVLVRTVPGHGQRWVELNQ